MPDRDLDPIGGFFDGLLGDAKRRAGAAAEAFIEREADIRRQIGAGLAGDVFAKAAKVAIVAARALGWSRERTLKELADLWGVSAPPLKASVRRPAR